MTVRTIESDAYIDLFDLDAVVVSTTFDPVGFVAVATTGVVGLTPNRARELAFSLLDLADSADIDAGTFSFDHDPFDDELATQAQPETL